MIEHEQQRSSREPPTPQAGGAWALVGEFCRRPAAAVERLRSWLFAEEDEYFGEGHRVGAEPPWRQREDPVVALFSFAVHLCGVAALGLVLYWHVPAVKAWSDHRLRGKRPSAPRQTKASLAAVNPEAAEDAQMAPPGFPADAPNPPPLSSPLPVSAGTPCIAVASGSRVSLYRADGVRLWSRPGDGAIFSPDGRVALLEREEAGWIVVDARTGEELPWSDDLEWVPPSAQVKWSPSGRWVCLEWPVSEESDRNALAVYDRSRRRWALQTALDGSIGCAVAASWSPDERYLALPAKRGALLFDLNGGARKRLPIHDNGAELLWEPSGRHLVASGPADRLAADASLIRYALGVGVVGEASVACIGPHAQPLGWMDDGTIVVYRTPCSGSYDGSSIYLAEWPSGDPIADLGDFGEPKISPDGQYVAVYGVNSESGGAGELEVTPLDGDTVSLDPRPLVGVPLSLLALPDEPAYRYTDEPVINWVLDYGWAPSGGDLYVLARRGLRSWCLWQWQAVTGAVRPVGRPVNWFRSPEQVKDHRFELIFLR